MKSLVQCAKCGKKPTVKANADRAAWTNVANPPCNEGGGPRYNFDDGAANSNFTSGLRAAAAQEGNHAAQKRSASCSTTRCSRALVGPERFYYDKRSYTGTHANGGPDHVAKGTGSATSQSWKRPDSGTGGVKVRDVAPTLLVHRTPSHSKALATAGSKDLHHTQARSASCGATSRPSTGGGAASLRPTSRGAGARRVVGPERFFYDKSSYTGTHVNGGPSSVAKGGGTSIDSSWKRRD